jgi:hypothetical protein
MRLLLLLLLLRRRRRRRILLLLSPPTPTPELRASQIPTPFRARTLSRSVPVYCARDDDAEVC